MKYNKLGKGEVHRCHKARVEKMIEGVEEEGRLCCPCGADLGIDKGTFFKMIRKTFTYSGSKVTSL